MRARFPWSPPLSDEEPHIEPLTPRDAASLRLPWLSRFTNSSLAERVSAATGMSLWVPRTGEYIFVEPWRHRTEIAQIAEVQARKGREALVRSAVAHLSKLEYRLALMSDDVWNEQSKLYSAVGFRHIERIVFFQKDLRPAGALEPSSLLPQLDFALATVRDVDLILRLDHDSFPWLWWNSKEEFEGYIGLPDVYAYYVYWQGEPAGYASFTTYGEWGHLDRLAVVERFQGHKLGAAQLLHALVVMRTLGVGLVGLSTQETNSQSHVLYKGFGFRQTQETMNFYALELQR